MLRRVRSHSGTHPKTTIDTAGPSASLNQLRRDHAANSQADAGDHEPSAALTETYPPEATGLERRPGHDDEYERGNSGRNRWTQVSPGNALMPRQLPRTNTLGQAGAGAGIRRRRRRAHSAAAIAAPALHHAAALNRQLGRPDEQHTRATSIRPIDKPPVPRLGGRRRRSHHETRAMTTAPAMRTTAIRVGVINGGPRREYEPRKPPRLNPESTISATPAQGEGHESARPKLERPLGGRARTTVGETVTGRAGEHRRRLCPSNVSSLSARPSSRARACTTPAGS